MSKNLGIRYVNQKEIVLLISLLVAERHSSPCTAVQHNATIVAEGIHHGLL
jgi:hypothetical protein